MYFLLFSRSEHQSTLKQENGFKQWKAPERINVHKNAKNHRQFFAQWKEMAKNLAENSGVVDAKLLLQIERESRNGVIF